MAEVSGKKGVRQSQRESRKNGRKNCQRTLREEKDTVKELHSKTFLPCQERCRELKRFPPQKHFKDDVESGLDHEARYIGTLE